ncbi:MAG: division/cell wall cluster transcriptional repressor MraZ, partial [Gammaproteobacteria bacterium]|nr:division/cell wall cluster transcriptional repressor MraZ [Gammaproteobacteria bacterium]
TVMLTGASIIQLDAKGRLAIPSRYREALAARSGGQLVTTVSFSVGKERDDRSLWMYPRDAWKRVAKKVAALPDFDANHRVFKRFFIGYASDMEMDRSGRVLLPALLRDFAAIGKGVCLIGQSNKFELWSEEKWRARHDQWLADAIDMDKISPELEQLSL